MYGVFKILQRLTWAMFCRKGKSNEAYTVLYDYLIFVFNTILAKRYLLKRKVHST